MQYAIRKLQNIKFSGKVQGKATIERGTLSITTPENLTLSQQALLRILLSTIQELQLPLHIIQALLFLLQM